MKTLNIMISINQLYLEQCKNMLYSLFKNNTNRKICVFLINNSLDETSVFILREYIAGLGGKMEYIIMKENLVENLPTTERFSIEMYYRIFSFHLLPKNIRRVLWLDSDLIVTGNIEAFYDQSFENNEIIACEDFASYSREIKLIKKKMEISDEHKYFNSGVLLFNLDLIRENYSLNSILEIIKKYKNVLVYPDQDILNKIFMGKTKYDNALKYNFQVNLVRDISVNKLGICILHYTGAKKPWLPKLAFPICRYYWKYQWSRGEYLQYVKFYAIYIFLAIPKFIKQIMKGENNGKN